MSIVAQQLGLVVRPILCINSSGLLNLNQVFSDGLNWNDQASAWWTGCYDDDFFVDINAEGGWAYAHGSVDGESSPGGNFPYGALATTNSHQSFS